jgi:peptide deformylase
MALVSRGRRVRVECMDEKGEPKTIEASGWYARILQHEIDHLHGILYVDRMYPRTLTTVENHKQYWLEKTVEQLKKELAADGQ